MPLYECRKNAENRIEVAAGHRDALVLGSAACARHLVAQIQARNAAAKHPVAVAFDGWYGIGWQGVNAAVAAAAQAAGLAVEFIPASRLFKSPADIAAYKRPYIGDDPSFGVVNTDGRLADLLDAGKVAALKRDLEAKRPATAAVKIVFGPAAAVPGLDAAYGLVAYFDKTRQPLLWEMWDGKLVPFGQDTPQADYAWKEYYYCDYYLLDRQKEHSFKRMDFWVEGIDAGKLKLLPRASYDAILQTTVRYPVKEVKIFQPGPWGAYRYKDLKHLMDVPGLECNAWNELAGPELSILVDIGREEPINFPFMNLLQYSTQFVGPYLHENFPGLFPLDIWLDDGYFPKPQPAERTSMPIHSHPGTDYVRKHFKEPIGRYETYYIAEAYEGANTWMGFKDDANLEEWERLCRASNNLTPIPNWQDYLANWKSNVGDLYLIPPGTTHGHGGNQMVLEMDTCPSIAGTEYSFFTYDFARPSWDDTTKTMTGKPCKMQLEHGFNNEKWVRASWLENRLRAKPEVVKWTQEYQIDRYSSDPRMPFEIERLHFDTRAEYDTQGRFAHIVTLTIGDRIIIRSKQDPRRQTEILKFQSAVIPAGFGEYELLHETNGACTAVLLRWKKG